MSSAWFLLSMRQDVTSAIPKSLGRHSICNGNASFDVATGCRTGKHQFTYQQSAICTLQFLLSRLEYTGRFGRPEQEAASSVADGSVCRFMHACWSNLSCMPADGYDDGMDMGPAVSSDDSGSDEEMTDSEPVPAAAHRFTP